mgnify:CR=1 FL=1
MIRKCDIPFYNQIVECDFKSGGGMGTVFSQPGSLQLQLQRNRAKYCVENIGLGSIYSGLANF